MEPSCFPITIVQGASFKLEVSYTDDNDLAISMSGYTLNAALWNRLGTQKLTDFSFSWVNQASGVFNMELAASVTSGITENGQYDLFATDALGKRTCLLEGPVTLNPSFTIRS